MYECCPSCYSFLETKLLDTFGGAVEIHGCNSCGGFWLDFDAVTKLNEGAIGRGALAERALARREEGVAVQEEGKRICPRCDLTLKVIEFRGIRLDRCETCMGIWFDYGELQQIAALAAASPPVENHRPAAPSSMPPKYETPLSKRPKGEFRSSAAKRTSRKNEYWGGGVSLHSYDYIPWWVDVLGILMRIVFRTRW